MTAEIIGVGTELLLGNILNTNARDLSELLSSAGINVYYQSVVGDNLKRIVNALQISFARSDLIIMTGGLGPTADDVTKRAVCDFCNLELELNPLVLKRIKAYTKTSGKKVSQSTETMAMVPASSIVFKNRNGTAPGIMVEKDGHIIVMLPGPPSECIPMFQSEVLPVLKRKSSHQMILSDFVRVFGMRESEVDRLLSDYIQNGINPTVAPYVKNGEVTLRITTKGKTAVQCRKLSRPVINDICRILGKNVYAVNEPNLETVVFKQLLAKHQTFSSAESCTGGLISKRITDIPGSSNVFIGGLCTYATETKIKFLGIDPSVVDKYGVVSEQVSRKMAEGVRRVFYSDYGIGITGYTGPDGDSFASGGTVYISVASAQYPTETICIDAGIQRERARAVASSYALFLLKNILDRES